MAEKIYSTENDPLNYAGAPPNVLPEREYGSVEAEPPEMTPEEETKLLQLEQLRGLEKVTDILNALHSLQNIAEDMKEDELDRVGRRVVEEYEADLRSRLPWMTQMEEAIKMARMIAEEKTWAGEKVANIIYPLIASASIQFAARAYPEVIKGPDVVKAKVIGTDPEGEKGRRGKRMAAHMSHEFLDVMDGWEESVDQLLTSLPILGCFFKKTYNSNGNNISEGVFPEDLVVDYFSKDLESASRVTHLLELRPNDIEERIRSGVFLEFDYKSPPKTTSADDGDVDRNADDDAPHLFLEQHRWLDLDDDGYKEPYVVTVHETSGKVVRIVARWDLDGVETNEKGDIVKITPTNYFTRFLFLRDPDGGFYGLGFGALLFHLNKTANTTINQLLDAGTRQNRGGGFIGRGVKLGVNRGSSGAKFPSGTWSNVSNSGDDLRKAIVPFPNVSPSPVLIELLKFIIDGGKELAMQTDAISGQNPPQNTPAATTLALIEQGLKLFSGVIKRLHRSLKLEFDKVRRLMRMFCDEQTYALEMDEPDADLSVDYSAADMDLIPVSDPNNASDLQRLTKAQALMDLRGTGLNDEEIVKYFIESLRVDSPERFIIVGEQPPDPLQEAEIALKQAETALAMAEAGKADAEAALSQEKINTEKILQQTKAGDTVTKAATAAADIEEKKRAGKEKPTEKNKK